ncbi:platelet-activating factor acetylhydrolase-like isoform X2 [Anneissia japonica]|nr:platelet-activating factor acetylhydrolase-like isoform X2 [Anneissia japonica]XP_033099099.1 platelet-activating factor acetylhydrolase-like isoform X2 [Anneissia japonica]
MTAAVARTRPSRGHGIPPGRGPFAVGLADIMSDNSKNGTFTRLYYPTDPPGDEFASENQPLWIPNRKYSDAYSNFIRATGSFSKRIFYWMFGSYRVPAMLHADVNKPPANQTFPVVVFSHGLGAMRTTYTTVCLDIASNGFIVAAVEHRDQSACTSYYLNDVSLTDAEPEYQKEYVDYLRVKDKTDEDFKIRNRQVNQRADECVRALDLLEKINEGEQITNFLGKEFDLSQFKGLLDLEKVSMTGHSFGGATTIQTLEKEPRFKVGVALDAWMYPLEKPMLKTVKQPLLLINTEKFHWPGNIAKMSHLVNPANQTEDRKMITIRGTVHQSQGDFPFLTNSFIGKYAKLQAETNPYVAMNYNNDALIAFLSRQLGIEYDAELDKIFVDGAVNEIIQGSNIHLDPERLAKSSL